MILRLQKFITKNPLCQLFFLTFSLIFPTKKNSLTYKYPVFWRFDTKIYLTFGGFILFFLYLRKKLMIKRIQEENILKYLKLKKIIYLVGARQVGKTTLVKNLLPRLPQPSIYLTGDDSFIASELSKNNLAHLQQFIGDNKTIVIDEAHLIPNIGTTLKLLYDNFQDLNIIALGSSAIELTDKISQPLTGRKVDIHLFPFAFRELASDHGLIQEKALLEHRLIYGYYPEVVTKPGYEKEILSLLSKEYLLKDIFKISNVKKPYILENLLTALALQLGEQVSYNELSRLLSIDKETVMRYIYLLEQAYIIFKVPAFSRNLRKEIKKGKKIYFYDNGIRNALINNFNPISKRNDIGALWENFLMAERRKMLFYHKPGTQMFFWRTKSQAEVDYVEQYQTELKAYEFKWSRSRKGKPRSFIEAYKVDIKTITKDNFIDFIFLNN